MSTIPESLVLVPLEHTRLSSCSGNLRTHLSWMSERMEVAGTRPSTFGTDGSTLLRRRHLLWVERKAFRAYGRGGSLFWGHSADTEPETKLCFCTARILPAPARDGRGGLPVQGKLCLFIATAVDPSVDFQYKASFCFVRRCRHSSNCTGFWMDFLVEVSESVGL